MSYNSRFIIEFWLVDCTIDATILLVKSTWFAKQEEIAWVILLGR